jgi:NAD(P)H-hydrate epimerase
MRLVSTSEMRGLEAAAIHAGVAEPQLQERAGAAVAAEVQRHLQPGEAVVVLAGPGNNGRDGAVAARHLALSGVQVSLFLGARHALQPDEIDRLRELAVRVSSADRTIDLREALNQARVAVDGLVGIGTHGALRAPLALYAEVLNQARADRSRGLTVVAVDIPSGIDADTGTVEGTAVRADHTVTFGAVKYGALLFPAAEYVGVLSVADIGIPDEPFEGPELLEAGSAVELIPSRQLGAHKYRFGRMLVIGGSRQYSGAVVLAARAAARSGAGLVAVAVPPELRPIMAGALPEATYLSGDLSEEDAQRSLEAVSEALSSASAVLIGPGLGRSPAAVGLLEGLLQRRASSEAKRPLVIDADALYALGQIEGWEKLLDEQVVLTPHSGELDRLAPRDSDSTPWAHAEELANRWGCTLVAKGPFTTIAAKGYRPAVWPHANPALATAGTGDVLAGLITGLCSQGLSGPEAACLAVVVHSQAASAIQAQRGWRTMLASDLIEEIPAELQRLSER